ncbi:CHAP domain-containing protein [Niveispirillum sp. BGYR6]|uniref:CHAP domain-containing protein n=1 Tax=Niveispirillum sp. BGYR6 TaxID=2971249 RepID=UPI0022B98426|nr:CHAP domain-containing protein [Niveispirillum sp. BGYR6]MDG5494134.1 CHAP domain-containing protein [Niveispirillum sp. BGYR6]
MKNMKTALLLSFFLSSTFSFVANALECTEYVNQKLANAGKVQLKGDAKYFADSVKNPGITVSSTPSASSIVVFDGTRVNSEGKTINFESRGHVGWVSSVNGGAFSYSDANWNRDGKEASHTASRVNNNWTKIKVDSGASTYNVIGYVTAPTK